MGGVDIQGDIKDASEVLTCTLKCGHEFPLWAWPSQAAQPGSYREVQLN